MSALHLILAALAPVFKAVAEAVVPVLMEKSREPQQVRYYGRDEAREADIHAGIDAERAAGQRVRERPGDSEAS